MLKRNKLQFLMVLVLVGALVLTGCSVQATPIAANRDTIYQVSTIDALINGVYDGVMTIGELKEHGNFGIGTFDSLDGEMAFFDGKVFQVKADGIPYLVINAATTPFAAVTYFETDRQASLAEGMTFTQLQVYLDSLLPTQNIFYAIKITGTFQYMKTRSVPRQTKPFPLLTEVTAHQPVFETIEVKGTIVGFRSPPFAKAVNVPGYHLHFVADSLKFGGHILDFTVTNATAYIDYTPEFSMTLPSSSDFYKLALSQDLESALNQVEKGNR